MKKWRFFPILVKEEVLKNMDQSEKLTFSNCSKRSCKLLSGVPNYLKSVIIREESVVVNEDFPFSLNDFSFLIACPYSTIEDLSVTIYNASAKLILEKMIFRERRTLLKWKSLEMSFHPEFYELYKELIEICDPSVLKTIKIPQLCTNGIYDSIVNTEQWRTCKTVHLNTDTSARHSSRLVVNYDDFLNFKNIFIGIESLSREDAWKLVKMYRAFTEEPGKFEVTFRQRAEPGDIVTKLDTELPRAVHTSEHRRCILVPGMKDYALAFEPFHFCFKGRIDLYYIRVVVNGIPRRSILGGYSV